MPEPLDELFEGMPHPSLILGCVGAVLFGIVSALVYAVFFYLTR